MTTPSAAEFELLLATLAKRERTELNSKIELVISKIKKREPVAWSLVDEFLLECESARTRQRDEAEKLPAFQWLKLQRGFRQAALCIDRLCQKKYRASLEEYSALWSRFNLEISIRDPRSAEDPGVVSGVSKCIVDFSNPRVLALPKLGRTARLRTAQHFLMFERDKPALEFARMAASSLYCYLFRDGPRMIRRAQEELEKAEQKVTKLRTALQEFESAMPEIRGPKREKRCKEYLSSANDQLEHLEKELASAIAAGRENYEVAKRSDRTDKERLLALNLWLYLDKYRYKPIVPIISHLMTMDCIANPVDQRTIERYISSWEQQRNTDRK